MARRMLRGPFDWLSLALGVCLAAACSASSGSGGNDDPGGAAGVGGSGTGSAGGTAGDAGICATGCAVCTPGTTSCVGNEVHKCAEDGKSQDEVVETCDVASGKLCGDGKCGTPCELAADSPSNVGCEFWAVDLDQIDYVTANDPASAPWGVVLSNAGSDPANVTIELNEAPPGQPPSLKVVKQASVAPGTLEKVVLPTRELDCGAKPNDYASPGTCLSSAAYRITSSYPIVVYQFNVFENAHSNDASLLLPTSALGKWHRVIGWIAGHPKLIQWPGTGEPLLDRSYVTVVGTKPGTKVKVRPSWRIKGNPPIPATPAGGEIVATLGPFDVLNLETDDGTDQDSNADLTGTVVESDQPVAVFSGTEQTGSPYPYSVPVASGGMNGGSYCCNDHLEEQLFPVESVGKKYVIPRSPVRSTTTWKEPDVLRFVGVAETAHVTTTLPPPYDQFTLEPGKSVTTWTQSDVTVSADKPVIVGQLLISGTLVDGLNGGALGDPALTVFPPIEQFRSDYVILTPGSWTVSWVVIVAKEGTKTMLDGSATDGCVAEPAVSLNGESYQSRRCSLAEGVHTLTGDGPFGIVMYGYGSAGSYAMAGGANVKKTYEPPPIQ
ncbi:MAG: IgGFc-binding protein [Polyangiaceae bacterium]